MALYQMICRIGVIIIISAGVGCTEEVPSGKASSGSGLMTATAQSIPASTKPDINPVTGSRLPPVVREDLDQFGQELYNSYIKEGRSFDEYAGPRGIRMHSPRVAEYMTAGNQYLRYEAGIDPKLLELTILIAAREMDNAYEWTSHEITAQTLGLAQELIDIVKYRRPVTENIGEQESAIIMLGREVLQNHAVSPDTYARASNLFGARKLVDIVSLLGHYTATAILLTAFDQQLPPDQRSLLTDR